MQYDDSGGGMQDDSNHTFNTNGNGNGARDVSEFDSPVTSNTNNEREKPNPFSRNRGNFNSGNDCSVGYGMHRESPAVIVNTNLLPFIQKLHDTMRKRGKNLKLYSSNSVSIPFLSICISSMTAISIMLSLLARLHNILDDNSNRELNGEYMSFWPTSVTKFVIFFV